MGNVLAGSAATGVVERSPDLETLEGKFETKAYLSCYSDVVALMVLEHQAEARPATNRSTPGRLSHSTRR